MADQKPFDTADPAEPVLVATAENSFEAGIIIATLDEAGVKARAFAAAAGALPMSTELLRVPVLVPQADLERARQVLAEQKVQASSIDWDSVDLGEDDSGTSGASPHRWMHRVWWLIALAALLFIFVTAYWWLPMIVRR